MTSSYPISDILEVVGTAPNPGRVDLTNGGTGITCDWNLVRKARKFGPVILAGGLSTDNIDEAITEVQPYGVDVCSGVEKSPGKKDRSKMRDFIVAAHNAIR